MRKFWHILSLVVFVGVSSCKKDKTPFPLDPPYNDLEQGWYTEDCSDSWPVHWVDSFNANSYYVDDDVVFKTPQFNPSNPDEIVYYHINYPENKRQLVKYNIKTTEKTVLASGITILGEPAWGTNGWVAFSDFPSYHIFKVKDDGTQLSQITTINANLDPQWSENGEAIFYGTGQQLTQALHYVKFNLTTGLLDTLSIGNAPQSISARNTKVKNNVALSLGLFNQEVYYSKADLNSLPLQAEPITNTNFNENSLTNFRCWSHDSQYIFLAYYATGDIYRVQVTTGEIEQIRSDCFGRWLHSIDASPDGKYLVVEKVNLRFTILPNGSASSAVRMQSHITLIDLQTGQMKDLDLE